VRRRRPSMSLQGETTKRPAIQSVYSALNRKGSQAESQAESQGTMAELSLRRQQTPFPGNVCKRITNVFDARCPLCLPLTLFSVLHLQE